MYTCDLVVFFAASCLVNARSARALSDSGNDSSWPSRHANRTYEFRGR